MALRTHPTTPINQIGFEVNTTVFPLRVNIFRVEAYANFKLDKDAGPHSLMARFVAIAKDALVKAENWQGEYQPTLLKVTHDTNSFVCIIPLRRSDVKIAEERVARGDVPVASPGTTYIRCEDKKHNPLVPSECDEVQEIIRLVRQRAAHRNISVWSDSAVRDAIDDYLAQIWSAPTEATENSNIEERSLVLYVGNSPRL